MNWKIEKDKLILTPESLLIPEFKELYDIEKAGIHHLKFVYLVCDKTLNNPLFNVAFDEKEIKAKQITYDYRNNTTNYIRFYDRDKEVIDRAIKVYDSLNEKSEYRLMSSIDKKIDEIRIMMNNIEPKIVENLNAGTGVTTFASNVKIILDVLQQIDDLLASKDSIEKRITKEIGKSKAKGDNKRSPLEQGLLNSVEL